jgi:integrase
MGLAMAVSPGPTLAGFVQRAVRAAVQAAGISKPATCHTFRHSFATHHQSDVKTAMIYIHVQNRGPSGVRSPADLL